MNAKTDFQTNDGMEVKAIDSRSDQGQRMLAISNAYVSLAKLSDLQSVVSAFALFLGAQSLDHGHTDEIFEQALAEFVHMARLNRAGLQSSIAGSKS